MCSMCPDGTMLIQAEDFSKCFSECPEGYYFEDGMCSECLPECPTCTGFFTCTSCIDEFYLLTVTMFDGY